MSRSSLRVSLSLAIAIASVVAVESGEDGHRRCGSCHLPADGKSPREGSALCISCHPPASLDGRGQGEAGRSIGAGPLKGHVLASGAPRSVIGIGGGESIEAFGCLTCHAAHDEGRPFRLRSLEKKDARGPGGETIDPISRVCLGCHSEFEKSRGWSGHYVRHPVGIPVPGMRRDAEMAQRLPLADTRGTESEDDDVIACWTCHVTHASSNPFLLRYRDDEQIAACTTCHEIDAPRIGGTRPRLTARRGR